MFAPRSEIQCVPGAAGRAALHMLQVRWPLHMLDARWLLHHAVFRWAAAYSEFAGLQSTGMCVLTTAWPFAGGYIGRMSGQHNASAVQGRYGTSGVRLAETRRSPILEISLLLAECIQHGLRTIAFCKTRKVCELVVSYTREVLKETAPLLASRIAVYRCAPCTAECYGCTAECYCCTQKCYGCTQKCYGCLHSASAVSRTA
jgi:hypothetical protein